MESGTDPTEARRFMAARTALRMGGVEALPELRRVEVRSGAARRLETPERHEQEA